MINIPGPRRAFTGAWIETRRKKRDPNLTLSRAFTGAWIETITVANFSSATNVAPSQARGLKRRSRRVVVTSLWSRLHRRVD